MKVKFLLYLLLTLPFLCSCNNEDNVNEIFISGTWNGGNFYNGGDWNKVNDGARPVYTKEEDLKAMNYLTVNFLEDGTIQGRISNGTYTARWAANGKDRTISITQIKTSATPTGKSKEMIEALKNAAYYKGDSKVLKLAPENKKSYIQLGHYSDK
ncbi:MAG: DUF4847 family protein [Bacteroides sp.]|nr:DUF4847 family protein [Bacteroides sp.]